MCELPTTVWYHIGLKKNCQGGINIYVHREKLSSIYRGIHTMKLAGLLKSENSNKKEEIINFVSLNSNEHTNNILSP